MEFGGYVAILVLALVGVAIFFILKWVLGGTKSILGKSAGAAWGGAKAIGGLGADLAKIAVTEKLRDKKRVESSTKIGEKAQEMKAVADTASQEDNFTTEQIASLEAEIGEVEKEIDEEQKSVVSSQEALNQELANLEQGQKRVQEVIGAVNQEEAAERAIEGEAEKFGKKLDTEATAIQDDEKVKEGLKSFNSSKKAIKRSISEREIILGKLNEAYAKLKTKTEESKELLAKAVNPEAEHVSPKDLKLDEYFSLNANIGQLEGELATKNDEVENLIEQRNSICQSLLGVAKEAKVMAENVAKEAVQKIGEEAVKVAEEKLAA
tara:strand:+ start:426 stop:1394 length:969 start_codon:yes stop_codon:yes gene_type:complete